MNRQFLIHLLWLLFAGQLFCAEYIVKLSDNADADNFKMHLSGRQFAARSPITVNNLPEKFKAFANGGIYLKLNVSEIELSAAEINAISVFPNLQWIEKNHAYRPHHIPNDTLFVKQWAMRRIGMENAYDLGRGNPAIIVGVIDTGVDYEHPDLKNQIWTNNAEDLNQNGILDAGDINGIDDDLNGYVDDVIGWDFTDAPNFPDGGDYRDPDNDPMDEFPGGHGTPVSGLIAAETDNITGMASVSPYSKIMPLRAGTANGFLEEDDVAEAIIYGVDNGCKIINMSFGDVVYSHLIKDAVSYGAARGVLFVTSAGNAGNTVLQFPAAYDETISVGAISENNTRAGFSSYGSKLDLVAPGQEIWSLSPAGEYRQVNGTSFSAPLVSGALASIWGNEPAAPASRIKAKLLTACLDIGATGWDYVYGNGLLMVDHAMSDSLPAFAAIDRPKTRAGVHQQKSIVVGTAAGPGFVEYTLAYGTGETPLQFSTIAGGNRQVINDTLGAWEIAALPDTTYTLELKVVHAHGEIVSRNVVYVDRTLPELDSLQMLPVWAGGRRAFLIELFFDDPVNAEVFYRQSGGVWQSRYSGYTGNIHAFSITRDMISGEAELYFRAVNVAGLSNEFNQNGAYYRIDLSASQNLNADFEKQFELPGFGYFLDQSADLDGDGAMELAAYAASPAHPESRLMLFSLTESGLQEFPADFPAFPRDFYDANNDGKLDLLAGFGGESYLSDGGDFPQNIPATSQLALNDLWAAKFAQLVPDAQPELLAIHQNEWRIFQLNDFSGGQVSEYQKLENPSGGANNYGVPFLLAGDFDGDQKQDVLLGDYDGDIIIFEQNAQNNYAPVFWRSLPGINATSRLAAGDFDGDGVKEFAAVTQKFVDYVGESAVDRQYWILSVFGNSADNQYRLIDRQYFHRINDQKGVFNGLSVADFDGDGKDELFFNPYPDAYYFEHSAENYLRLTWFSGGVNANAFPKIDHDRCLIVGDSTLSVWRVRGDSGAPPVPPGFRIVAADSNYVSLAWQGAGGAASYKLIKKNIDTGELNILSIGEEFYRDTLVTQGRLYQYQLRAVDSSFTPPLSGMSVALRVKAESPPRFRELEVISSRQLLLSFTKKLGPASYDAQKFTMDRPPVHPKSVLRAAGNLKALLTFEEELHAGPHGLRIDHLENEFYVPFLTEPLYLAFTVAAQQNAPYVLGYELLSKSKIKISFSEKMDRATLLNLENYRFKPTVNLLSAEADFADGRAVSLNIARNHRIGGFGENYLLHLSGLKSESGTALASESETISLSRTIHSLDDLIVFPNPLKSGGELDEIRFGNVPPGTEIYIFTSRGQRVCKIEEMPENGAVSWNLKNSDGRRVGNGVYIYRATLNSQEKTGKFAIVK